MSRRIVGLLALLLAVPAACGVPTDARPRAISEDAVPSDLLAADPVSTTTTVVVGASTRVRIYLVGGEPGRERLVPVERPVQAPATAARVLSTLTSGPNREEAAQGLRSAILPGTVVNSVLVESSIAVVDLVKGPIGVNLTDQILALAQMVYTVTELSGVGAVRFTLDGDRALVPDGTGEPTARSVGRAAYAVYAPL